MSYGDLEKRKRNLRSKLFEENGYKFEKNTYERILQKNIKRLIEKNYYIDSKQLKKIQK